MTDRFVYARRATFAAAAFIAGAVFASGMNWTRHADAQPRTLAQAPISSSSIAVAPADFSTIAARVTPAVVSIRAEHDAASAGTRRGNSSPAIPPEIQRFFQFGEPQGVPRMFQMPDPQEQGGTATGSGFIVSPAGYVLTNNHVVDGADRVTVGLPDRREFKAKVVGRDPQTDVAVLKIDGSNLPTLPLGDDSQARVGDWVLAVGNPLQLDFTVTAGIISAKGRANELRDLNSNKYAIQDFIQTDAAINPGNSGGPLVNTRGEVIGINSAIASPTGSYAGYGFAIPVTLAKTVMDDLIAHGHVRRAILGATIADVTQEDAAAAKLKAIAGVKIEDFNPADNSPAKRAGMERGDIVVAADGKAVDRVSELQRIIRTHQPGDELAFENVRYGEHLKFRVRLGTAPGDDGAVASNADDGNGANDDTGETRSVKPLGITVGPLPTDSDGSVQVKGSVHGVRVTQVRRGGPAEGKLIPGDIISDVIHPEPKVATGTVAQLNDALRKLHKGDYVGLLISRQSDAAGNRTTAVVNVQLGE